MSAAEEAIAGLRRAGEVVEQTVTPEGSYGGWTGHDVLVHLSAYARIVGAVLRGAAEGRKPTETDLYSRTLTASERAMTDLNAINQAVVDEHAHLSYDQAHELWRGLHQQVLRQADRLSIEQLTAPVPDSASQWWRPHLFDLVTYLSSHYRAHVTGQPH